MLPSLPLPPSLMPLMLLLLLFLFGDTEALHPATRVQDPSKDFSTHKVVRPRIYHGRSKREISSSRESNTDHVDLLSVGLELNGESRILDLRLNTDLIPVGYKERHQHQGSFKTHVPSKVEVCHYQGTIRDLPGSWAAVSTCRGLKGVIFDGEALHHIEPEEESLQAAHYLYRHSDLLSNNTCGYKGTPHNVAEEFQVKSTKVGRVDRHKRAAESIRGPYNANRRSRYVELVLVIDKNEYTALGENLTRVHHHCKDIANIINALYTPLNIFIALVGVEVWTDADEIHLLSNGDTTLNNFLQYRRERLVKTIPNDNAQLLTKMHFDEGVVGKALKGPICTYEFSGGVSVDHSNVVGLVAATVAHEMGHNFGMEHDSSECDCPEERCIMAPSSGSSGPTHWSSCSLDYLALAFEHGMDYCLRNKPQRLFDSPICGNGFVEPGEQCDCGLTEKCDNPCCDASSCMLHANASCATGECCDLKSCRPKAAGTECRSAEQECDLPEYCTGQSEYCPTDVFKIDGESCSMGKAYCYQGNCRTHNDQCKLLWGPTGSSSDALCYQMNNKGNKTGNCGYNRTGNNYIKCHEQNILCGMLHCKHLNERLEFGMESVATLSHSFINSQGNIIACRSAIVDLGLNQVDPGLAPDGAKCSHGKMCVKQKCIPVAELRTMFPQGKACPNNCSGNGVCNSLGHCHCNRGYQPPDCTEPGVGGSEDSGPAEDPNARSEYIMSLYIIFLGIVPTIALVSLGIWYTRTNGGTAKQWKKTSAGPMSTITRGFGFGGHQEDRHQRHQRTAPVVKTIDRSSPLPRSGLDVLDGGMPSVGMQHQDPASESLLAKSDPDERFNNNFFGQFKGFSISPLPVKQPLEPTSELPSQPTSQTMSQTKSEWTGSSVAATVPIKTNPRGVRPAGGIRAPPNNEKSELKMPPALPPPNAGSCARPLISSPILAATTCKTLELKVPTRAAPKVPGSAQPVQSVPTSEIRASSSSSSTDTATGSRSSERPAASTLNRIASMLYPMVRGGTETANPPRYSANSLPRNPRNPRNQFNQLKVSKVLDREHLRNLEISHPIPQKEIEIPGLAIPVHATESAEPAEPAGSERSRAVRPVTRAHSMRDPKVSHRPAIHTFGSMRQSDGRRPTSIAAVATRPTSPPPGPPGPPGPSVRPAKGPSPVAADTSPTTLSKTTGLPQDAAYDDCMNLLAETNLEKISEESPTSDNIYAVIEESLPEKHRPARAPPIADSEYKSPKNLPTSALATPDKESLGLLSEIVSEISSRNFDSIYSTKTISATEASSPSDEGTYANDGAPHYKSPESLYSNSTTSSGYLHPSAVNVASKPELQAKEPKQLKDVDKSSSERPSGSPSESPSKSPSESPKKKNEIKKEEVVKTSRAGLNRTRTPPTLTTKKVTSREVSNPSPKEAKFNSPDLVSSCSPASASKSPDVLGRSAGKVGGSGEKALGRTQTQPRQKMTGTVLPAKPSPPLVKSASLLDKSKSAPAKRSGKSNVASLQEKFEQADKSASGTLGRKKATGTTVNSSAQGPK